MTKDSYIDRKWAKGYLDRLVFEVLIARPTRQRAKPLRRKAQTAMIAVRAKELVDGKFRGLAGEGKGRGGA